MKEYKRMYIVMLCGYCVIVVGKRLSYYAPNNCLFLEQNAKLRSVHYRVYTIGGYPLLFVDYAFMVYILCLVVGKYSKKTDRL